MAESLVSVTPAGSLERLYRERGDELWWAVLAYAGDREIASDAVAEAFAQALRRGDAIRQPERWIWHAAFRIAAGLLKERRRMTSTGIESSYEMADPAIDLLTALRHLSPKQRASVVLFHGSGYQVREIARILGSTPPAIRVHLSAARKRLRDLLGDDDA